LGIIFVERMESKGVKKYKNYKRNAMQLQGPIYHVLVFSNIFLSYGEPGDIHRRHSDVNSFEI